MIRQCNFGTTVEIFLQNGIALLSRDLERHLLEPSLYFDGAKRGHYIRYTQIRKEHSIRSVSCFRHERSSRQFFRYVMFKLSLLGYLLQEKVGISANVSRYIWSSLKCSHISFFLIKLNENGDGNCIVETRFQVSKILVRCSGIPGGLKMFLQPHSSVNIGFYQGIYFFGEYLVVTLSKFWTDSNRPCRNIGDFVETSLNM